MCLIFSNGKKLSNSLGLDKFLTFTTRVEAPSCPHCLRWTRRTLGGGDVNSSTVEAQLTTESGAESSPTERFDHFQLPGHPYSLLGQDADATNCLNLTPDDYFLDCFIDV